jgi:hypothetical protein
LKIFLCVIIDSEPSLLPMLNLKSEDFEDN